MIRFLALAIVFYIFNVGGCSNSIDSPINSQLKDPRTYTWTIDTLFYAPPNQSIGQTSIKALWGLGDTLVYAVGFDAWGGHGSMWQYNGKIWLRVKLRQTEGGPQSQGFSLNAITGFSANNIFACGETFSNFTGEFVYSPLVMQFDGLQWREASIPKGGSIISVIGMQPSHIYCGGENGSLYKYDGNIWSLDTIKFTPYPDVMLQVRLAGLASDGGIYIQTFQYNDKTGEEYSQFLNYKPNHITLIDSSGSRINWGGYFYWQSNSGSMYSCGVGGVYKLVGEKWELFHSMETISTLYGAAENHIFAVTSSRVYYFDGNSWEAVFSFPNDAMTFARVWCSSNEVFIAYSDATRSYILHGK